MTLRKHQVDTVAMCDRILAGDTTGGFIAFVTPGGGKSALPVIIAHKLLGEIADRICWVVPRNSLRTQGEKEFLEPRWNTPVRLRAAENGNDLSRGTDGYITTYQAIAANPFVHIREFDRHRYIIFLDEVHHVSDSGEWERALAQVVERAVLVVPVSGTLERGDGRDIAFLDPSFPVIRYTRRDALQEKAIAPISTHLIDGQAEWITREGKTEATRSLSGSGPKAAAALFTALRTDFALHLLDEAANHWKQHREQHFQSAKLLVVSPDIAHAKTYLQHVRRYGQALLATSEDSPAASRAIERFRNDDDLNILVSVALAYEGLSVPPITHIACLTHIRSKPWLEQCFARANRLFPGKISGFVFAPADPMFREAADLIERDERSTVSDSRDQWSGGSGEGSGAKEDFVTPVSSAAHNVTAWEVKDQVLNPDVYRDSGLTPGEQESILRKQINSHIKQFLASKRPGSKQLWQKKVWRRVKEITGGKLADQSPEVLVEVWTVLREEFPC